MQPESQKSLNWTVNSATHSLEITTFEPGKQYSVRVAAVNGAGVGVQSDPKQLTIGQSHQDPTVGFGDPRIWGHIQGRGHRALSPVKADWCPECSLYCLSLTQNTLMVNDNVGPSV